MQTKRHLARRSSGWEICKPFFVAKTSTARVDLGVFVVHSSGLPRSIEYGAEATVLPLTPAEYDPDMVMNPSGQLVGRLTGETKQLHCDWDLD